MVPLWGEEFMTHIIKDPRVSHKCDDKGGKSLHYIVRMLALLLVAVLAAVGYAALLLVLQRRRYNHFPQPPTTG